MIFIFFLNLILSLLTELLKKYLAFRYEIGSIGAYSYVVLFCGFIDLTVVEGCRRDFDFSFSWEKGLVLFRNEGNVLFNAFN